MKDVYKHDPQGVATIIATLKETRSNYEDKITSLTNLSNEIASSNAWRDLTVKTAFNETCNSYLQIYRTVANAMDKYERYLEEKSNAAAQLEQNYTRGD